MTLPLSLVPLSGNTHVSAKYSRRSTAQPMLRLSGSLRPHNQYPHRSQSKRLVHARYQQDASFKPAVCGDAGEECLAEDVQGEVLVRDDLEPLLQLLPPDIRAPLACHPQRVQLIEVVLDLGRRPEARFQGAAGGEYLREGEVTAMELQAAEAAAGAFGSDNRAGVAGTLHRISALRSRRGAVIGLTCRVGRAVTGHTNMLRDLVESGHSVLLLGRPGVGKTTVIREIARVLADERRKRVVIVDTSNEIGGDSDVAHGAIGSARRMQVPNADKQHLVMVEAVENHMPEVVIVDEIGTEAEALACRSIAERGVQLIGTAHGRLLGNLIKNVTLSDLIGGIQSVTLGDEAAKSRGSQKTVLERKGPPTFPIVIEIRDRAFYVAHWTQDSVDALLCNKVPTVQVRERGPNGSTDVRIAELSYDKVVDPSDSSLAGPLGGSSYAAAYEEALQNLRGEAAAVLHNGTQDLDQWAWAEKLNKTLGPLMPAQTGSSSPSKAGAASSAVANNILPAWPAGIRSASLLSTSGGSAESKRNSSGSAGGNSSKRSKAKVCRL